jgi:hypothetical protein
MMDAIVSVVTGAGGILAISLARHCPARHALLL